MLGNNAFYYNTIKKYIVAFGSLFNDIHVIRTDKNGIMVKDIKVPITFADKSKVAYQINSIHSRANEEYPIGSILPRISYNLNNSIEYDSARALNPLLQRAKTIRGGYSSDSDISVGRPFNFSFQLSIWTKYLDDMFQIIEQVLTFFHPDYHVTIKEIPELNIETSIPIVFQSCSPNIENEFEEQGQRVIKFDIDFVMKGWLYPPIKSNDIINNIQFNFLNNSENNNLVSTVRNEFDEEINKYYSAVIENIDPYFSSVENNENMMMGNNIPSIISTFYDKEFYDNLTPVISLRVESNNELDNVGNVYYNTNDTNIRFNILNSGSNKTAFDYSIENNKTNVELDTAYNVVLSNKNNFVYAIKNENNDAVLGVRIIDENTVKVISDKKVSVSIAQIDSYLEKGISFFSGNSGYTDITLSDHANIKSIYDINFIIVPVYDNDSQIGKEGRFGYKVINKNRIRIFNNGESSITFKWCLLKAVVEKVNIEPVSQIVLNVYKTDVEPILSENEFSAYWFNTINNNRYFIQKNKDGSQTVTLI